MSTRELTLYTRLGCHLCEDMESLLPSYLDDAGLNLNIIYIDFPLLLRIIAVNLII